MGLFLSETFGDVGMGAGDDGNPLEALGRQQPREFGPSIGTGSTHYTDRSTLLRVQSALNTKGENPPLKVDGVFGPKTEAAISRFMAGRGSDFHGPPDDTVLDALGIPPPGTAAAVQRERGRSVVLPPVTIVGNRPPVNPVTSPAGTTSPGSGGVFLASLGGSATAIGLGLVAGLALVLRGRKKKAAGGSRHGRRSARR